MPIVCSSLTYTVESGMDIGQDAFTIPEFCQRNRFSNSFYFKIKAQGLGPREMHVGKRTLISIEAAEQWRREREAAIEFCAAIHAWALRAGNHPPRRRSGGWRKDGREHLRVHGPSCCARLLSGQSPASARPLSALRLANGLYPQTPAARVPMDSLSQPFHKHSDTERACRFDRSPLCARPGNRR
jgi:hypothetical protein